MRSSPTSRSSRRGANGASPRAPRFVAFAEQHQIPIAKDKRGDAPFSTDANLLHVSSEGKVLEDPAQETPHYVYSRTVDPESAPDKPTVIEIAFEKGDPVADRRQGDEPGDPADSAQHTTAMTMESAGSTWSRTASSA